jgi:hypothetical protein
MLDLVGSVAGLMAVTVDIIAITAVLPLSLIQRLKLGAVLGAWTGLASGLGAAGFLEFTPGQPVPLVGVLCVAPLLVVGALSIAYPSVRHALLNTPTHLLIGLNSLRIIGALFLMLAAAGRLSGPFPYSAGLGDIITGAFAIPLARAVGRGGVLPRKAIASWNLLGTLDLVAAVSLGLASANASPLQIIHARQLGGNAAEALLPSVDGARALLPYHSRRGGCTARRQPPRIPVQSTASVT